MSDLVLLAGGDSETEEEFYEEARKDSVRLTEVVKRLGDLDSLLLVTTSPTLVKEYNSLIKEKKELQYSLFNY